MIPWLCRFLRWFVDCFPRDGAGARNDTGQGALCSWRVILCIGRRVCNTGLKNKCEIGSLSGSVGNNRWFIVIVGQPGRIVLLLHRLCLLDCNGYIDRVRASGKQQRTELLQPWDSSDGSKSKWTCMRSLLPDIQWSPISLFYLRCTRVAKLVRKEGRFQREACYWDFHFRYRHNMDGLAITKNYLRVKWTKQQLYRFF